MEVKIEGKETRMTGAEFEALCSNRMSCKECPKGKLQGWGEHACSIKNEDIDWSESNV